MAVKRAVPRAIQRLERGEPGSYILEFRIERALRIEVGKLGKFEMKPGWYYYVGSARNGLGARLRRHSLGPGKIHWHIDYITRILPPCRIWFVVSDQRLEDRLARVVGAKCRPAVIGFGCGDSPGSETHLYYSGRSRDFAREMSELGEARRVRVG